MKKLPIIALLISSAMSMSSCDKKSQVSLEYEKYTLPNGLEVVLHQDKSDPIVSVAIQYHVGSKNEKPGKTGFAHFFEHMLFQRSENLPRNAFFQKIDALGGTFNGSTSNDGTNYYETVPRDALEKVLWMESDRMGFFINTVTEGGLKREIDVVSNEKRQGENAPYGLSYDLLFKNMFPEGHPYSWTVIGEIPDLRSATVEDVKEFYNKYYTPSNATLVIAGDFDVAQTKELVEKYFGEIASRPKPEPMAVQNVKLDSIKKLYHEDSFCNAPMILMAFPSVEAHNPDGYALDFLTNVLASDKKSPLYKVLVEERKLIPSLDMFNYQLEIAGLVVINATTFPGVKLDDVYDGIQEAFARFEKDGIDPKDLERYKLMEATKTYNSLTSTNGKALTMAYNNVFTGSPDNSLKDLEKYNAVTVDDLMRVYNKYIKGQNYINISIVPSGSVALAMNGSTLAVVEQESIEDQQLNSEAGAIVDDPYEKSPSKLDRSIEPELLSNTPILNTPAIWTSSLSNGMTVKGIDYKELPLVYFSIDLNSGSLHETADKAGLARMTASMLNEGTALKTPEELEEAIGQLGASVRVSAGSETMTISGNCIKDKFPEVITLVEEILLQPRWDEKSFEVVKERTLDNIRQNATQPDYIANNLFMKLTFNKENAMGTEETISAMTMDDVKSFYNDFISPSVSKMSYVGGHSQAEVEKITAPLTAKWQAKEVANPSFNPGTVNATAKLYFVDYPDARQSSILIGKKAMAASDPQAYYATIVNDKLGASSGSLLFEILRLQRGYTYGAYSYFVQSNLLNSFMARSSVQATVTKESMEIFRDILKGYGEQYNEEFLKTSTNAMSRSMNGSFETPDALRGMLRNIVVYNQPEDYVKQQEDILNTITMDQAKDQIKNNMNFDDMIIVVVGDAKTQFAPLTKLDLGEVILVDKNGKPVK